MSFLQRGTRITAGAVLVALVALPVYVLLDSPGTGLAGEDALKVATHARSVLLLGSGIVLVLAAVVARAVGADRLEDWSRRVGTALTHPGSVSFGATLALLTAVVTVAFSLGVLRGKPNLVDAMAQLLHARYIAAGMLAAPAAEWSQFWHVQNSVITPEGWVSQYPPGYPLMLALGLRIGAVWLIGPLLAGAAVFFTVLVADRLLDRHRAAARLGCIMLAGSPLFIGLAGAYMNHVAASALFSLSLFLALRARGQRGSIWAAATGATLAASLAVRPLTALVAGVVVAGIWLTPWSLLPHLPEGFGGGDERGARASGGNLARRQLSLWSATAVGAAPVLALLGAYNARFFGTPTRFAYAHAQGPAVGLGFHVDPWGNDYGLREAIAYTSSDLTTLSLGLLETPFPVVAIVGLYLIIARRLTDGERIVALWALLPVLANAFYWHHGIFMGPRMLSDATPAWCLLTAVSAIGIVRRLPSRLQVREYSLRGTIVAAFLVSYLGAVAWLAPERLIRYRSFMPSSRIETPRTVEPSLVFVHGGWTSRVAMRLAAAGMRLDSVETALRENPTCRVHRFARWYAGGRRGKSPELVDFSPTPGSAFPLVAVSKGNMIRVGGDELTADCLHEIAADTLGIVDVSPMVWQGDLPALDGDGVLLARDFGPAENAVLLARHPWRTPYVFYRPGEDDPPRLAPYDEGMAELWGERRRAAGAARSAGEADR